MLIIGAGRFKEVIEQAVREAASRANDEAQGFLNKYKTVADLQKEITKLEIERDKKLEEWARKEREIEHKVGLEKKRQEFEIVQAKRETSVEVKEENLKADKERFKGEMDFQRKRLEEEVKSLRELVDAMLKRLPSAEIYAQIGAKK